MVCGWPSQASPKRAISLGLPKERCVSAMAQKRVGMWLCPGSCAQIVIKVCWLGAQSAYRTEEYALSTRGNRANRALANLVWIVGHLDYAVLPPGDYAFK